MSEWHCFKCKVEVEEDDVPMLYLDMLGFHPGMVCRKCGLMLLPESVGWGLVRKDEEEIEAKMD